MATTGRSPSNTWICVMNGRITLGEGKDSTEYPRWCRLLYDSRGVASMGRPELSSGDLRPRKSAVRLPSRVGGCGRAVSTKAGPGLTGRRHRS